MLVIGLDAAAQLDKCGYAIGTRTTTGIRLEEAGLLGGKKARTRSIAELAARIRVSTKALIAIDAPLGWPQAMGEELVGHLAGERFQARRARLFRRHTEEVVRALTGRTPLEVGAERLAHAAHHALDLLGELRAISGRRIPLAWTTDDGTHVAIEVYPAGTLAGHGLPSTGYKKAKRGAGEAFARSRGQITAALEQRLDGLSDYRDSPPDVFDACLCLLSALDFLTGACTGPNPDERSLAAKEGWIWVRSRQ